MYTRKVKDNRQLTKLPLEKKLTKENKTIRRR